MPTLAARQPKESRLELRVKQQDKRLLEEAAGLNGQSVTTYLLSHGLSAARRDRAQALLLETPARNRLLKLLEHPPKPNAALRRALQRAGSLHG